MFCQGEKCHCILSVAEEERFNRTGVQKCFVCIQKGKEHADGLVDRVNGWQKGRSENG